MTTALLRPQKAADIIRAACSFSMAVPLIGLYLLLLAGCAIEGVGGDEALARPINKKSVMSPTISLSPIKLEFSANQSGSNPPGQAVAISNAGVAKFSWSVSADAPWLAVSPTSWTGAGSITATAIVAGMAAGTYLGHITVASTGATNTPQTIPVSFTVSAPSPAAMISPATISLSPASLALSAAQGGSNPSGAVAISNSSSGMLGWSASTTAPWLSLSPGSGTAPGSLTATANISGMAAGTYSATISLFAAGTTNTLETVPVTLTVSASQPTTTSALLSWLPNSDPTVVGFFVHYGTQSPNASGSCAYAQGTYLPLSSATAASPTATITNLPTGTTYYFAVSSYNGSKESTCSNEVSKAT